MSGVPDKREQCTAPQFRRPYDFLIADIQNGPLGSKIGDEDIKEAIQAGTFDGLMLDPVTRLPRGNYRVAVLKDCQAMIQRQCSLGFDPGSFWYIEVDVQNLGGANAALGHQRSNEDVLAPLAEIFLSAVNSAAQSCVSFRHGGDEFSAVLGPMTERDLTTVLDTMVRRSLRYAREVGLHLLQNPKHPNNNRFLGIGLRYGFSHIDAKRSTSEIFSDADQRVEKAKRGMKPDDQDPSELTEEDRARLAEDSES